MRLLKSLLFFSFFLFVFLPFSKAEIILNSNDWKDGVIVTLYGIYTNQKFFFVPSLSEAQFLSMILPKDQNYLIFESKENSVVKNAEKFLSVRGFQNLETLTYRNVYDLQFILFNRVKQTISGIVIVKDDFGYEGLSVVPYAVDNHYWILFYDKKDKKKIISFIKNNPHFTYLFYGEYLDRPWKKAKAQNYIIVDKGNFFENNLYLNEKLLEGKAVRSALVSDGKRLGEFFFVENYKGLPVFFTEENVTRLVELSKKFGLIYFYLLFPESTFPPKLKAASDALNTTLHLSVGGVEARIIDGKVTQHLRRYLSVPEPTYRFEIEKIYYDIPKKQLILVIRNDGNIGVNYYISGVGFYNGKKETFPDISYNTIHFLPKEEVISIPIELNSTIIPEEAEILVSHGYSFPLEVTETIRRNVTLLNYTPKCSLALKRVFYDVYREKIGIEVKNEGNKSCWVSGEFHNITILDKEKTFFIKGGLISPGETKEFNIDEDIYLEDEDLDSFDSVQFDMFCGKNKTLLIFYERYELPLSPKKSIITAFSVWIKENTLYAVGGLVLLGLVALSLYLQKKRRKKKRRVRKKA